MKKVIRLNMFETNSSSTHSLTLKIKKPNEKWKTEEELIKLDDEDVEFKELGNIWGDIHREIRSKKAKIEILYQSYTNYYISRKSYFISELGEMKGFEILDYNSINEFYGKKFISFLAFNINEISKTAQEKLDNFFKEEDLLEIELTKIKQRLNDEANKLDEEDKKEVFDVFKKVDKNPCDDETAIGLYFGNSLLDMYENYNGIFDFVRALKLDMMKPNLMLRLIDRMLQDDVYFETKEGVMAEDTIPRIS